MSDEEALCARRSCSGCELAPSTAPSPRQSRLCYWSEPRAQLFTTAHRLLLNAPAEKLAEGQLGKGEGHGPSGSDQTRRVSKRWVLRGLLPVSPGTVQSEGRDRYTDAQEDGQARHPCNW